MLLARSDHGALSRVWATHRLLDMSVVSAGKRSGKATNRTPSTYVDEKLVSRRGQCGCVRRERCRPGMYATGVTKSPDQVVVPVL
jgi:hypothetical protein